MRRRLSAVVLALAAMLVLAAPAFADTSPGPGNFRDSGSSEYAYASGAECGSSTCTETNVYSQTTKLRGGDTFSQICVDQYTYPLRGGNHVSGYSGCSDAAPVIADDLSSASMNATILAESCGRRSCTTKEISLSVSLDAIGGSNAYSYTQKQGYENCTDTYRVRGDVADAEGTIVVNGTSLDAYGQIGAESFAYSSRCR